MWGGDLGFGQGIPSPGVGGGDPVNLCRTSEERSNCRPSSQRFPPAAHTCLGGGGQGPRAARADPLPAPQGTSQVDAS